LHTQVQLVRADECDDDINPDLFQDNGWNPDAPENKDKKKPPHELITATCGCEDLFKALQKALNKCYEAEKAKADADKEKEKSDQAAKDAKDKADTAATDAKDAKDKAEKATTDAKDAKDAKDKADKAKAAADKDKTKTAKDKADAAGAAKEAGKAKADADKAKTAADKAAKEAKDKPEKADKAKTAADKAAKEAKEKADKADQAATAAKEEVKKQWEALQNKLDICKNYTGPKRQPLKPGEVRLKGVKTEDGGDVIIPAIPDKPTCEDLDKYEQKILKIRAALLHGGYPGDTTEAIQQLNDALKKVADLKAKLPCPSPTPTLKEQKSMLPGIPEEHGMAPKKPGDTCAVLIATGKIKVETSGTGETIGTVVNLTVQNQTDQPLNCVFPPTLFESISGKNQSYACPSGQTVALNPHQTKTVPINGVCLNRNKPPVAKGVSGDLVMNEANPSAPQNPNSHLPATDAGKLLRSCAAKYTAADQLQKSGALKNLPYHDPQKQKDIVVQWSTWTDPQICQIVGTTPATKDDLKKVVYKQVEKKGPMSPETKKKVDQGINTIFEKVELTTAKAKDLEKPEGESSPPTETPAG